MFESNSNSFLDTMFKETQPILPVNFIWKKNKKTAHWVGCWRNGITFQKLWATFKCSSFEHIGKRSRGEWNPRPQRDTYTKKRRADYLTLPSRKGSHHSHKPERLTCRSPQGLATSPSVAEQRRSPQRWKRTYTSERHPSLTHSQRRQVWMTAT